MFPPSAHCILTALLLTTATMAQHSQPPDPQPARAQVGDAFGIGLPPPHLPPGQGRLMAERAATVRAVRNAQTGQTDAHLIAQSPHPQAAINQRPPQPTISRGTVRVQGYVGRFEIIETRIAPNGSVTVRVKLNFPASDAGPVSPLAQRAAAKAVEQVLQDRLRQTSFPPQNRLSPPHHAKPAIHDELRDIRQQQTELLRRQQQLDLRIRQLEARLQPTQPPSPLRNGSRAF